MCFKNRVRGILRRARDMFYGWMGLEDSLEIRFRKAQAASFLED